MKRALLSLAAFLALGVSAASIYLSPVINAQTQTSKPSTATNAIIISSQGTLSAQGQYTQSTGVFERFIEGTPTPTPSPTPSPTCTPSDGSPGFTFYTGTYSLSNGDEGSFFMSVPDGTTDATDAAIPDEFPNYPQLVEQGNATITLQVDPDSGAGTGSISFTSQGVGITGTIVVNFKFHTPPTGPTTCGSPTPTPTPTVSPTPTPTPTPTISPTPSPTPTVSPTPTGSPTPTPTTTITGRVTSPTGQGLRNVQMRLVDSHGVTHLALTSSLGFYSFDNIETGTTVTIAASSKRYRFAQKNVQVTQGMGSVDFTGVE